MRIEVDQVCVNYNGFVALHNATLNLPAGSICGLVGMNGAGKSTLFRVLTGFVNPSQGRIHINGMTVAQAQRVQSVAYMPQNENIDCNFPISVWNVVMMGRYGNMNMLRIPRGCDRAAVRHALKQVELLELSGRPIATLSGGQRKRCFLARAIAQHASVLLLDEPFNSVDVQTEKLIVDLLLQLQVEGRTILISTHDLSQVRNFCNLVVLINKTILAYGNTSEIFTQDNLALTFGGMPSNLPFSKSFPKTFL